MCLPPSVSWLGVAAVGWHTRRGIYGRGHVNSRVGMGDRAQNVMLPKKGNPKAVLSWSARRTTTWAQYDRATLRWSRINPTLFSLGSTEPRHRLVTRRVEGAVRVRRNQVQSRSGPRICYGFQATFRKMSFCTRVGQAWCLLGGGGGADPTFKWNALYLWCMHATCYNTTCTGYYCEKNKNKMGRVKGMVWTTNIVVQWRWLWPGTIIY